MEKLKNLRDLLIEEGRELYDANRQELKELTRFEMEASTPDLKKLINKKSQQTKSQQQHLREAFDHLRENCDGAKCVTTQTILKRALQLINKSKTKEIRDAGIISSLQQLSHRKIAGLGNGASHAREIGQEKTARTLHDALEQEKQMDRELSSLAQLNINRKAVFAAVI